MINEASFFNTPIPPQENKPESEELVMEKFREAATEYFAAKFQGDEGEDYEKYVKRLESLRSAESALSKEDAMRIVDEVRQELLHLPESLMVSSRAMARLEHSLEAYEISTYSWSEISGRDRNMLIEKFPDVAAYLKYEDIGGDCSYLIAKSGDNPVGLTIYREGYVDYQAADTNGPGLGLGMLKLVVEESKERGIEEIRTITAKIPRGLGNLGFSYVEGLGGENAPTYVCNLRQEK